MIRFADAPEPRYVEEWRYSTVATVDRLHNAMKRYCRRRRYYGDESVPTESDMSARISRSLFDSN